MVFLFAGGAFFKISCDDLKTHAAQSPGQICINSCCLAGEYKRERCDTDMHSVFCCNTEQSMLKRI